MGYRRVAQPRRPLIETWTGPPGRSLHDQETRRALVTQWLTQLLLDAVGQRQWAASAVQLINDFSPSTAMTCGPGQPLSCPVSSRGLLILVEEGLEGLVPVGVVGGVVLPAAPDDVQPGSGEDAHGVGVVVASAAGAVVDVGGPGAGMAGVAGEVGDGVAQLF